MKDLDTNTGIEVHFAKVIYSTKNPMHTDTHTHMNAHMFWSWW